MNPFTQNRLKTAARNDVRNEAYYLLQVGADPEWVFPTLQSLGSECRKRQRREFEKFQKMTRHDADNYTKHDENIKECEKLIKKNEKYKDVIVGNEDEERTRHREGFYKKTLESLKYEISVLEKKIIKLEKEKEIIYRGLLMLQQEFSSKVMSIEQNYNEMFFVYSGEARIIYNKIKKRPDPEMPNQTPTVRKYDAARLLGTTEDYQPGNMVIANFTTNQIFMSHRPAPPHTSDFAKLSEPVRNNPAADILGEEYIEEI